MEGIQDWAKSDDGGTTDSDIEFEDWNDEERQPYNSGSIPKFQPRKAASKAQWIEEIGMAEVVVKKGGKWISTGIIRGGKLYCTIEEIAFLAERGALILVDDDDIAIPLKVIYAKIANGGYGCCWESFEVYRHLKSLGYIVSRHGSPWTLKGDQGSCNSISCVNASENSDESENGAEENTSIIHQLMDIIITAIKPKFSVYLPNSKYRKSSPGDPNFILCLLRENPPSEAQLLNIEKDYKGVSLKFCNVESGRFRSCTTVRQFRRFPFTFRCRRIVQANSHPFDRTCNSYRENLDEAFLAESG
ncbi:hypothetical protein ACLOJK_018077 [Asimina triloba]